MKAIEIIMESGSVERIGWALLHSVWQIGLLAALCFLVMRMMRKRSAEARYLVGCVALLLMTIAPLVTLLILPSSSGIRLAAHSQTTSPFEIPMLEPSSRKTTDRLEQATAGAATIARH
jgi:hypothetical protein